MPLEQSRFFWSRRTCLIRPRVPPEPGSHGGPGRACRGGGGADGGQSPALSSAGPRDASEQGPGGSLAVTHIELGTLLKDSRKPSEADSEYRKALAIQQELANINPKVPSYRDNAANTANNLSIVLRRLGHAAEARELCERAVAIREALIMENPSTTGYRTGLAETCLKRGLARRALGEYAGAVADILRAVELYVALSPRQSSQLRTEKAVLAPTSD